MGPNDARAYEALIGHAKLGDFVAIAREVLGSAASTGRAEWTDVAKVTTKAEELKLTREESATPFGNALAVLERGPEDDAERGLAAALWAHVLAETRATTSEEEDKAAADLLWLATRTPFDATGLVDRALGERADDLWTAVADRIRRIDAGKLAPLGRGEGMIGCAALAMSTSAGAGKHATTLALELKDRAFGRVLAGRVAPTSMPPAPVAAVATPEPASPPPPSAARKEKEKEEPSPKELQAPAPSAARVEPPLPEDKMSGELLPTPRGPIATAALALTGILFVVHVVRIIGKVALSYKRPAEVTLSHDSVRISSRTEMLGRTLREREVVISRAGLARAMREVRYPRLPFYAGLLALAVGSYIGISTLVDGVRSASPSLLLAGLAIIGVGIALDFVLGSLAPGATGQVRVAFVPRKGPTVCVGKLDAKRADAALHRLAHAR